MFNVNSFMSVVMNSPEGTIFRHPTQGFASRVKDRVVYLDAPDPQTARNTIMEFLDLVDNIQNRWGELPRDWSWFRNARPLA
jgi:hypothetical protein